MKYRFFDFRLWREGSRQLSLIGIMSFVVMEIAAILYPVGYYVNHVQVKYTPIIGPSGPTTLSSISMLPLLVLLPTVIAPLLTLYLYRFLNKRNASDFYHQLPARRECLFLSFFAAIASWLAVITVVPTLTTQLLFRILLHDVYIVNLAELWQFAANMFVGGLLVAASAALVMSVTGNLFNNVVGTGLLLFLPRIVMGILKALLLNAVPILPETGGLSLLDSHYNIPAGMVLWLWDGGSFDEVLFSSASCLYTLVLAAVYLGIATWLFCRRKSESAAHASRSRRMQGLLRVVLGFAVSLIPCTMIASELLDGTAANLFGDLFWLIVLYIVVLLAMLIYELITTRRWRYLTRAFSSFAIVLGLNVLFLLSALGIRAQVLSFAPTADEIVSVQFSAADKNDFFSNRTAEARFEDNYIRMLVSNALDRSVTRVREGSSGSYSDVLTYEVRIHTNGRSALRKVWFTAEEAKVLTTRLTRQDAFKAAYTDLPEWSNKLIFTTTAPVDPARLPAVYNQLKNDIANCDFDTWYQCHSGGNQNPSPFRMQLGQDSHVSYFYLPWEFVGTCDMLLLEYNEKQNADMLAQQIRDARTLVRNVHIQGASAKATEITGFNISMDFNLEKTTIDTKLLLKLLENSDPPSAEDPLLEVQVGYSVLNEYSEMVIYIPVNEKNRQYLYELMLKHEGGHAGSFELRFYPLKGHLNTYHPLAFQLEIPQTELLFFLEDNGTEHLLEIDVPAQEQEELLALCEGIYYRCSDPRLVDGAIIFGVHVDEHETCYLTLTADLTAIRVHPGYYRFLTEDEQESLRAILEKYDLLATQDY